jgi:methyl-accepting chemotaxis protein
MALGWTVSRKLVLGFCLGPLALLGIGVITYSNTDGLMQRRDLLLASYQRMEVVAELRGHLVDAESGQRGYIIVGDESYLEPYRAALASIEADLGKLQALVGGNLGQQAQLQRLRPLITSKLDGLATSVSLRREKGLEAALAQVQTGRGKRAMDDIRAALDEIMRNERAIAERRSAEAASLAHSTFDWITYGTAICFLLLTVIGYLITRSITRPVSRAVTSLASSASQILAATTEQAAGMRQQSMAVEETVATVEQALQTSEEAAVRAKTVADSAQRTAEISSSGQQAIEDSIAAMENVREQTSLIADSIVTLAEQAQAIGEIIAAVNDIAEQTNLLSLNAAIEASRAGDHGRGFSVVATEIRALADQSKKATTQVRQILGEIQRATNKAVIVTEEGTKSTNTAAHAVEAAGQTIRALSKTVSEAAQLAVQIAASANQQAAGMTQIHQAMTQINQASVQQLAATRQTEQTAHDLLAIGTQLKRMIVSAGA